MKIAIASDHGGFALKTALIAPLTEIGLVKDFGPSSSESCDYPDYAGKVALEVASGGADFGGLICRSGVGMAMAANRYQGVRAAICSTTDGATLSRQHNGANVLCLGADVVSTEYAVEIAKAFFATPVDMSERHVRRREKVERAGRLSDASGLAAADPEVFEAIRAQTEQEDTEINLIASENTSSRACREAAGSVLMNKYAEGYPGKRWYSGCLPVDAAEELARKRACELFGAEHANVQPHCGSAANMAVYFACIKPGDTIMSMSLDQGGHLSHGSPVNFSGKIYNIVPYTVDPKTEMLDYDAIERQALEVKPKILLTGASAYPRTIDFRRIREICDKVGCIMMVDMAHIAGLVAAGEHPSPVPYADVVTTTTHKTLRGPRGGMILCREEYAKAIDKAVFPGTQGGPLMHIIAAKAVALGEALTDEFKAYQHQIVVNAKCLSEELLARGIELVSGGTDNHLMLLKLVNAGVTGKELERRLDEVHITANKNTIPGEPLSPFVTSGLRIGTPAVTTRGFREPEMKQIAGWIADAIADFDANRERISAEVAELCAKFPIYAE